MAYQTGKWYYNTECGELIDWCVENNKPVFAIYSDVNTCTYCEKWHSACIGTTEFTTYMANSNIYFGCCNSQTAKTYNILLPYIENLCQGSISLFPFGMIYKNSTFNEYFQRPGQQQTISKVGRARSWIRYPDELITVLNQYQTTYYTVSFKDNAIFGGTTLKPEFEVESGTDAEPPNNPDHEAAGYRFYEWQPNYTNIIADTTCIAQYKKLYGVTFKDNALFGNLILKEEQKVVENDDAVAPDTPIHKSFEFSIWDPTNVAITSNRTCIAQYQDQIVQNKLANSLFKNNSKLATITIPSNISSIGDETFSGCTQLTGITIPTSISSIGNNAFSNSVKVVDMTNFTYTSTCPTLGTNSFDTNILQTIKFSNRSVAQKFAHNEQWKQYQTKFTPTIVYYISFDSNDGTGTMSPLEVYVGNYWYCPYNTFSAPTNMVFDSFNSKSDGSGSSYKPGESYYFGSASNITLYAIWKFTAATASNTYLITVSLDYEDVSGVNPLVGMTNDSTRIKNLVSVNSSNVTTLTNSNATKANIVAALNSVVNNDNCKLLIFHYSGHGGGADKSDSAGTVVQPGREGENDPSGNDQYMCVYKNTKTYDKFWDNEFWDCVKNAKCRIVTLFCCCYPGSMFRSINLSTELSSTELSSTELSNNISSTVINNGSWASSFTKFTQNNYLSCTATDNSNIPNLICFSAADENTVTYMVKNTGHTYLTHIINKYMSTETYDAAITRYLSSVYYSKIAGQVTKVGKDFGYLTLFK